MVYSIKPSLATFAEDNWHPERERAEIRRMLDIGQGARMEFIMRDISSLRANPNAFWNGHRLPWRKCLASHGRSGCMHPG